MPYVIACGDEGVQLNQGTRLGFVGAGFRLEHFADALKALKKTFGRGQKLLVASNEESPWIKEVLNLNDWDQINASMQQHIEALADREKLLYAGFIPFSDPKMLEHEIKAHMVRPRGIHIANKICFTLGGGEQKFNLGCYVISADWLAESDLKTARAVILPQVEFYKKLAKKDLPFVFEEAGELGKDVAKKNRKILEKMGIASAV